jgi:pyridoxamine 5'-phosphate oxidase
VTTVGIFDVRADYDAAPFDVADASPDPIAQWWRWYDDAVTAGCVEPNAMTLATVDVAGRPDARYVLLRGATAVGFDFYTNLESAKGHDLSVHPDGALVFGWLETHRQVRVRGPVGRVPDPEADAYWASRPRDSQLGGWASAQSSVIGSRAELEERVAQAAARFADVDVPRPPHWGGFRLAPAVLEFWQGRPNRLHDRIRYRREGDAWMLERLSP